VMIKLNMENPQLVEREQV